MAETMNDYAKALGWMTIRWTALEASIDNLIAKLVPLPEDMWYATLGHLDLRDRVWMLKSIGFVRKPDKLWFDELEAVLNEIDNDLRPERNRFIHDVWIDGAEITKVNRAPKIKSTPGSGELVFQPYDRSPVALTDITRITTRLTVAESALAELEQAYPTPGPLMRISAQLFLRGTGAGAPRPKEQMPKAPRPPPRSSPKSDG